MSLTQKLSGATPRKSDRTRDAVREAAAGCFREHGYDGATSAEIARHAAVAEGTVFLHHGSKAGLLNAVTIAYYAEIQTEVEVLAAAEGDAASRLIDLVDAWARRLERDWSLINVFVQRANATPGSELAATVTTQSRAYTRVFVGVIEELKATGRVNPATPSSFIRDVLFGALEHTARGQAGKGGAVDVHHTGRLAVELVLNSPRETTTGDRLSNVEAKLDDVLARVGGAADASGDDARIRER